MSIIGCIKQIRLHVETGTETDAQSSSCHILELKVSDTSVSFEIPCDKDGFCDLGEVYEFNYGISGYIHREGITSVSLKQGGDDGLLIKSVFTSYVSDCGILLPLTVDRDFNKWVDGNDDASMLEQKLTLV